jgi:hypothetical protein
MMTIIADALFLLILAFVYWKFVLPENIKMRNEVKLVRELLTELKERREK